MFLGTVLVFYLKTVLKWIWKILKDFFYLIKTFTYNVFLNFFSVLDVSFSLFMLIVLILKTNNFLWYFYTFLFSVRYLILLWKDCVQLILFYNHKRYKNIEVISVSLVILYPSLIPIGKVSSPFWLLIIVFFYRLE